MGSHRSRIVVSALFALLLIGFVVSTSVPIDTRQVLVDCNSSRINKRFSWIRGERSVYESIDILHSDSEEVVCMALPSKQTIKLYIL
jgi:hypothetical protein